MSCQKKATGKFMKVVWNHTATNWEPAFLNKIVAIRLMTGHMMQMIIMEIAAVIYGVGSYSDDGKRRF